MPIHGKYITLIWTPNKLVY